MTASQSRNSLRHNYSHKFLSSQTSTATICNNKIILNVQETESLAAGNNETLKSPNNVATSNILTDNASENKYYIFAIFI